MNDDSQKDKLRQHFARRVTTQARVVLDTWQKIHEDTGQSAAFRGDFAGQPTSWFATQSASTWKAMPIPGARFLT